MFFGAGLLLKLSATFVVLGWMSAWLASVTILMVVVSVLIMIVMVVVVAATVIGECVLVLVQRVG